MIILKILATIFVLITIFEYYSFHIIDPNFRSKSYETFAYMMLAVITLGVIWLK